MLPLYVDAHIALTIDTVVNCLVVAFLLPAFGVRCPTMKKLRLKLLRRSPSQNSQDGGPEGGPESNVGVAQSPKKKSPGRGYGPVAPDSDVDCKPMQRILHPERALRKEQHVSHRLMLGS